MQRARGRAIEPIRVPGGPCRFDGCHRPSRAGGLCATHWHQRYRGEEPRAFRAHVFNDILLDQTGDAFIVLTDRRGGETGRVRIDASDLDLIRGPRWALNGAGYARRNERRTGVLMHRLLLACPCHMEVDHINADPLDNRRTNLRMVTREENAQNVAQRGREQDRNVYRLGSRPGFYVRVRCGGRNLCLGHFPERADAIAAARDARDAHFTHANEDRHR